jgi:ribosomal protein L11 methyltransferase
MRREKPRSYSSVVLETPSALQDEAAGIFAAYGSLGCETRKFANGRPPRSSDRARLIAWFDQLKPAALRRLTIVLRDAGMIAENSALHVNRVVDPGWATMWQKRFEPFPIGARFLVVPPWNRAHRDDRIPLVIRPGQAFGTGHHASTYGTLIIIEQLFGTRSFTRALDVGTGSGILAIAMRKLGAAKIIALDLDPIALENAVENAELNAVERNVRFTTAPLSSIRGQFDIITANILSSVLIEMAVQLKMRIKPGGYLILAGILAREVDSVTSAYRPELRLRRTRAEGAWRALLLQR